MHLDVLPDVLRHGLDIVFCGTAASTRSAQVGQYYAGPGNKFWPTLFKLGFIPIPLTPADFSQLANYGMGLSDVVKHQSGADKDLNFKKNQRLDLVEKINLFQPKILCFNGKKAAQIFLKQSKVDYGLQARVLGNTLLFVAPSTSGAANASWDIDVWQNLKSLHTRLRD